MGLTIKRVGPQFKVGEVLEAGTYDTKKMKMVFERNLTVKKIHRSTELTGSDYFEFKEIPGHFITHGAFYKKGHFKKI